MEELAIQAIPSLRHPTLITAFGGWPDAGEVATGSLRYLVKKLMVSKFAQLEAEHFYDFARLRPLTLLSEGGKRSLAWPSNEFYYGQGEDPSPDLVLFLGSEPHLRWKAYCQAVLGLAERCGVKLVVTLGGVYDNVAHRGEPKLSGMANREGLERELRELGIGPTSYQGPASIQSALREFCSERGLPCLSLWGHAPSYIQVVPNLKVCYGLLRKLGQLLKLRVDLGEVRAAGEALEEQVERALAHNSELQAYVRKLEEAAGPEEMSSPEVIVKELEEFLRRQREKQGGNEGPRAG